MHAVYNVGLQDNNSIQHLTWTENPPLNSRGVRHTLLYLLSGNKLDLNCPIEIRSFCLPCDGHIMC
jgi:hypothetical protein